MDTTSYWLGSAKLPSFPKLSKNIAVDVIVVGAGITGVTSACLLKKAGLTVALIERDRCGRIDTGHTTAHLTAVTDLSPRELAKKFSPEIAKAVWDAGAAAIDQMVTLIRAGDIACDFQWVPGYLHAPLFEASEKDAASLREEAEFVRDLGIRAEFEEAIPYFGLPGVKFPHQALFHPAKYLAALVATIPGKGSHVFENSAVEEIQDKPLVVKSGGFEITGRHLVLATHNPLSGNSAMIGALLFQTKLSLYSSYVIGARLPSGLLPSASFWDTSDPYYYLRVEPKNGHDYAIFGGEDHKTGQAEDTAAIFQRLETRFLEKVPQAEVLHRWSGQVIETNDGLPFIGATAENQFIATGFSGNGMTFGTLGGMMAADSIVGRKNPWTKLFDPGRKKIFGGTWSYLSENKDYPYYLVREWLARTEGKDLGELKSGEGKILQLGGKKVAAHRDAAGHVSLCSPVCTHLQCIVAWNNAEQTWDCPCHGSRFKPTGEVISGPAEEDLEKIEVPADTSHAS